MQILKFMSDRHFKIWDPGPSKGRKHSGPDPAKHLGMSLPMSTCKSMAMKQLKWAIAFDPSMLLKSAECNNTTLTGTIWGYQYKIQLLIWFYKLSCISCAGVTFVCVLWIEWWLQFKWKEFPQNKKTGHQCSLLKTQGDSHRRKHR